MKSLTLWHIAGLIICILLMTVTRIWDMGRIASITNSGISFLWFIWLVGLNIIANHLWLDDKLSIEDKLLTYPWYKLALVGGGIAAIMLYINNPFDKLVASFALSSIVFGRDHRWSAFLAIDMLSIVIVMLITKEQSLADTYAIYLYYFLVIATLTMLMNTKKSSEEENINHIS